MEKKVHFVLDLDQTLIYGETTANVKKLSKKPDFVQHKMENDYIIFERPFLQPFLDYIFENYIVTVWTAASKNYATFIIKNILLKNKARKIDFVLFKYHVKISEYYTKHTKELKMFWDNFKIQGYNEKNTLILDDNVEEVYNPQKSSCILAKEFIATEKDSSSDDFLKVLLEKLKKDMNTKDIRPVVEKINKEMEVIVN